MEEHEEELENKILYQPTEPRHYSGSDAIDWSLDESGQYDDGSLSMPSTLVWDGVKLAMFYRDELPTGEQKTMFREIHDQYDKVKSAVDLPILEINEEGNPRVSGTGTVTFDETGGPVMVALKDEEE